MHGATHFFRFNYKYPDAESPDEPMIVINRPQGLNLAMDESQTPVRVLAR